MANTCRECGGDVFIGELRCPSCKAPIPNAREVAMAEGVAVESGSGGGPPPPEGLGLLIDKMQTDREIDRGIEREAWGNYAPGSASGITWGDSGTRSLDETLDDVADLVRPERDARGNIKYDLKYALVGAVVVAIVAGLAFWYVYNLVTAASNVTKLSRVS
jgi:hypothetical protein